jgi:hypothetical protein
MIGNDEINQPFELRLWQIWVSENTKVTVMSIMGQLHYNGSGILKLVADTETLNIEH